MDVLLVAWLGCGVVAAMIASGKHRSAGNFFLAGLLLGPLGVLIAAVVSPDQAARDRHLVSIGKLRACPACLTALPPQASVCRACRADLPPVRTNRWGYIIKG